MIMAGVTKAASPPPELKMQDNECVRFLQWALPQLQMRWPGFRKVRKQVCKRLARRLVSLGLDDLDAYQHRLNESGEEWQHLDSLCRVVVTRFFRDKRVFAELAERILPQLASSASASGRLQLRAWSIGSASGEEPYSLAILWHHQLAPRFPPLQFAILATEIDPVLIERSLRACYPATTLKNLPAELRSAAFTLSDDNYCLKPVYRKYVQFREEDIRTTLPGGNFDLILCRNLAFTYFDESLQATIVQHLLEHLVPDGILLLGVHETLPAGSSGHLVVSQRLGLYQRVSSDNNRSTTRQSTMKQTHHTDRAGNKGRSNDRD
jgi:chemotaxis protein methyltransferase CheR